MILANALLGTVSVAMSNIATMLLPLTIWFVIVSVLPFSIAAFSYFLFGEKMGLVSLIASVLSFGAIVLLTLADPAEDTNVDQASTEISAIESEQEDQNYLMGVIFTLACLLGFSGIMITTRQMQEVHSLLVM